MAITDALGTIGKQAAGSLIGQISKAIIEIEDERFAAGDVTVTEETRRNAASSVLGSTGGALGNALQNGAQRLAESGLPGASALGQLGQAATQGAGTKTIRKFEVKFNPSEISFQANGGRRIAKTNHSAEGVIRADYVEVRTKVQVRVPLIFDDYERTETFMMEKFTDPMALVRMGVTSAASAITNRVHSVMPQVEGFIGALRNAKTNKLTFNWGGLCYKGVLNELSATYTMFSIEGRPVRAVVQIGFMCSDENEQHGNMGQWRESYRKAFSGESSKLESVTQNVGNLLNINL